MSEAVRLPAAERARVPWKNGGGMTQTVAAFPDGAGPDDFLWRVSIAEVGEAGPFSIFPATDRHLSVIEGRLRLDIAGRPSVELSCGTDGLAFAGDVAADGTPVGGAVIDLNVMTRRGRFRAEVERLDADRPTTIAAATALLVAAAPTDIRCGDDQYELGRLDALSLPDRVGQPLLVGRGGPIHLVQIF